MVLLLNSAILTISFLILWKGSNLLVDGASSIAHHLKIPEYFIGLTLVAFGTSLPEVVVNIVAALQNKSDIVFGNIIGSNIANILLILGITGLISPVIITNNKIKKEMILSLLFTITIVIMLFISPLIEPGFTGLKLPESLILLILFGLFLNFIYKSASDKDDTLNIYHPDYSMPKSIIIALSGLILIPVSGKMIIESAIYISRSFGISEALISITAIAFGTSLPELVTSIASAVKHKHEIVLGNITGSLIFNTLFAFGLSSLVSPIRFNPVLIPDMLILIIANTALILYTAAAKKASSGRYKSSFLIISYIIYIIYIFFRG